VQLLVCELRKLLHFCVALCDLYPISFYFIRREALITCAVCAIRLIHLRHLKCLNGCKSTLIHRHAGATCKLCTEIQLLGCVNIVCLLLHITCGNELSISGSELRGKCFKISYCSCDILQRSQ